MDNFLNTNVTHIIRLFLTNISLNITISGVSLSSGFVGTIVAGLRSGNWGTIVVILLGLWGRWGWSRGVAGATSLAWTLIWTGVSADLNGTLEVDLHAVGELESLEVGIAEHAGTGTKVLDFVKLGHELGSGDTTLLVNKLDWSSLAIMGHTVADQHVKLLFIILDSKHHGHGLTNLDQTGHLAGPWTLAHLDLHPAADIITGKVSTNNIQHVNWEWSEKVVSIIDTSHFSLNDTVVK